MRRHASSIAVQSHLRYRGERQLDFNRLSACENPRDRALRNFSQGYDVGKLEKVQGLRAIAAILVIIDHSLTMIPNYEFMTPFAWFLGEQGVAIFFIISGFIMAYRPTDHRSTVAAKVFFFKRLERVAPLYWIMTIFAATLIASGTWLKGRSVSLTDILMSLFFIPYGDGVSAMRPVLGQGWTLNYEMFFYALFAASLFFPRKLGLSLLSAIIFTLCIVGFVVGPGFTGRDPTTALQFYTSPHLILFLFGIIIGVNADKITKTQLGVMPFTTATIILITSSLVFLIFTNALYIPIYWRLLFWLSDFIIVICCVAAGARVVTSRSSVILEYLGDASYSIYLSHFFGLTVAAKVYSIVLGWTFPYAFLAFAMLSAILSGIIVYTLVEKPLINFFRVRRF